MPLVQRLTCDNCRKYGVTCWNTGACVDMKGKKLKFNLFV